MEYGQKKGRSCEQPFEKPECGFDVFTGNPVPDDSLAFGFVNHWNILYSEALRSDVVALAIAGESFAAGAVHDVSGMLCGYRPECYFAVKVYFDDGGNYVCKWALSRRDYVNLCGPANLAEALYQRGDGLFVCGH